MSNGNNSTRVVMQMFFKPGNSFGIQMVCRFVQKQNIRLLQKQAAQSNTSPFTTRKNINHLIRRRTTQSIHCKFKIIIQIPCITGIKFFLNFSLSGTKLVKICIRVAKSFVNFVKFFQEICNWLYTFFYTLHYSFSRFQIRFLFEISDCVSRCKCCFTSKVLVNSSQNLKKARLSRTIWADYTYFCPIIV